VGKLATVCSALLDRSDLTTAIVPPDEELPLGLSMNGSQVVPAPPELPPLEELELLPLELDELEELELPLLEDELELELPLLEDELELELAPLEDELELELAPLEDELELELLLEEELAPPEELELPLDELLELELELLPELEELEPLLDEPPEDELPLEPEPPLSSWWQAPRRSATLRDRTSGKTCDAVFIWGPQGTGCCRTGAKYLPLCTKA
jgi:hypothetical protein